MDAVKVLGFASSLLMIAVYALYYRGIFRGKIIPNPATWFAWAAMMAINALTYASITGHWAQNLVMYAISVLSVSVFAYSVVTRKSSQIRIIDAAIVAGCIVIGYFWQTAGDAWTANLLLQLLVVLSFVPLVCGLLSGANREEPLPWLIAVLSWALQVIAVIVGFNGDWLTLAGVQNVCA